MTLLKCHLNPTLMFLFVLLSVSGVQKAEEAEMKLMASTPHRSHIFSVANFDMIKSIQKKFITRVCAGVDDQLSSLASGEEGEMWWKSLLVYLVLIRILVKPTVNSVGPVKTVFSLKAPSKAQKLTRYTSSVYSVNIWTERGAASPKSDC